MKRSLTTLFTGLGAATVTAVSSLPWLHGGVAAAATACTGVCGACGGACMPTAAVGLAAFLYAGVLRKGLGVPKEEPNPCDRTNGAKEEG